LASRAELRLADLEHETLPRWKGVPSGGTGPEIADVPQMIQMITLGRTIAMLPRSLVEPLPQGLTSVPVTDATPSRLVVAWSQLNRRPLIASFVHAAVAASVSQSQPLARLATVDASGAPQNNPVGAFLDEETGDILIGGHAMVASRKFRNVRANGQVALVYFDVTTPFDITPHTWWAVRGVEGRARRLGRDRRRGCRRGVAGAPRRRERRRVHERGRPGLADRAGGRADRQLLQPGTVRQAKQPALGAGDQPGRPAAVAGRAGGRAVDEEPSGQRSGRGQLRVRAPHPGGQLRRRHRMYPDHWQVRPGSPRRRQAVASGSGPGGRQAALIDIAQDLLLARLRLVISTGW
jgi:PPOX class F420-dependent enzyme/OxyR family protein